MSDPRKRLHTLLTDRAVAGLDAAHLAELDHLLVGAAVDPSYEAAAAAIELALIAHAAAIPETVKAAVLAEAEAYWGFASARGRETSVGGPQASRSLPELRFPDEDDDELLGDDFLLGDPESSAVRELWEAQHGPFESVEDAIESGVLESSLTNGRIDRAAKPSDSQRNPVPPDVARLRERAARRFDPEVESREDLTPVEPRKAEAGDSLETPAVKGPGRSRAGLSRSGLDRAGLSRSEASRSGASRSGASTSGASTSGVVPMPVSESRVVRLATYASAVLALLMFASAVWLYTHRDDPPEPDEVREEIEAAGDMITWSFTTKADPAVSEGASGSVSWSSTLQSGVLELSGLAINDPTESQYQLWIVDKTREGPSVDGGVFDVASEGEIEVAIDAKLLIGEPTAFVITIERPGGVVVSERSRVVMEATGP